MPRLNGNLNYCLALVFVWSTIAIGWVVPPVKRLFMRPGEIDSIYYNINYIAIAIVICLVSATWWFRGGIVPTPITSKARLIQKIGSIAMAVGNGAIALALIVSLIGFAMNREFGVAVGFIFAAAFMLAFPVDIFGIFCVETSRLIDKFQSSRPQE